jgi:hypothetical protein
VDWRRVKSPGEGGAVTEAEWLACADPTPMLEFLRGKASERKLRLFAVACCRRVWHLLTDHRSRKAVEVCEKNADGLAHSRDLRVAAEAAIEATNGPFDGSYRDVLGAYLHAAMAAWWASESPDSWEVDEVRNRVFSATVCDPDDPEVEDEVQARLLRDIFGPLSFRPSPPILPAILAWNNRTVPRLAQAAYDERCLPEGTLDPGRLDILADALLDAGCDYEGLLAHLRSPEPHVRGCWAVDMILGKE